MIASASRCGRRDWELGVVRRGGCRRAPIRPRVSGNLGSRCRDNRRRLAGAPVFPRGGRAGTLCRTMTDHFLSSSTTAVMTRIERPRLLWRQRDDRVIVPPSPTEDRRALHRRRHRGRERPRCLPSSLRLRRLTRQRHPPRRAQPSVRCPRAVRRPGRSGGRKPSPGGICGGTGSKSAFTACPPSHARLAARHRWDRSTL